MLAQFTLLVIVMNTAVRLSLQETASLHHQMSEMEVRHYLGSSNVLYEVVHIPHRPNSTARPQHHEPLRIHAFGRTYDLQLRANSWLVSAVSRLIRDGSEQHLLDAATCHLLQDSAHLTAAISRCRHDQTRGIIVSGTERLEISPLSRRLQRVWREMNKRAGGIAAVGTPHLVRRANLSTVAAPHSLHTRNQLDDRLKFHGGPGHSHQPPSRNVKRASARKKQTSSGQKVLELAVFVDKAAQTSFLPILDDNDDDLTHFILAFINQVQAIYYLPSLGERVDITVNHLELLSHDQIPHHGGDRGKLLDSFCLYNADMNQRTPIGAQWDMGLYLSGLDFFSSDDRNTATMGLAVIDGVCHESFSCVIGELGATDNKGAPYPSAGFTATYITAHEIGHNLGLTHDSQGNACARDGHIMSPSRGLRAETVWSRCSKQQLQLSKAMCLYDVPTKPSEFNHSMLKQLPGQLYDAALQCSLFSKHNTADVYNRHQLHDVCKNIKCRSANRIGYFYAGPALEGTYCGDRSWCRAGQCVPWPSPAPDIVEGGWTPWNVTRCASGCIDKAQAVSYSRRSCTMPRPRNSVSGCDGSMETVELCDDTELCNFRQTARQYATQKCSELSHFVSSIAPRAGGIQIPHNSRKPWSACSLYCRTADGRWYSPRTDLQYLDIAWYFPDGSWCHNDGLQDYFCRNHICKPKVLLRMSAGMLADDDVTDDSNLSGVNAADADDGYWSDTESPEEDEEQPHSQQLVDEHDVMTIQQMQQFRENSV